MSIISRSTPQATVGYQNRSYHRRKSYRGQKEDICQAARALSKGPRNTVYHLVRFLSLVRRQGLKQGWLTKLAFRGRRFRYTYYHKDKDHGIHLNRNNASSTIVRPIYESIQALDHQGIKAIESLSFDQFENYLNETDNTICGRNPIGVLLACLEEMKGDRSARCLKYAQSSKCRTLEDSSVSYASIYIQVVPEQ